MAVTTSGVFGLTKEKMYIDTMAQSMEAETHKAMLTNDSYTPNFTTHDFRNDVTNEVSGTGYTAGGKAFTGTEITMGTNVLKFDHDDVSWSASTITAAMCMVGYFNVGLNTTDALIYLLDFITAVTTASGLLLVQIASTGVFTEELIP